MSGPKMNPLRKLACVLGAGAMLGLAIWLMRFPDSAEPLAAHGIRSSPVRTPADRGGAPTVGDAWRWENFSARDRAAARKAAEGASAEPFTVAGIHHALRRVELDEHGAVVVDDKALDALRSTFAALDTKLSATQLARMQDVIRDGLPGQGGEDVARIVADYYRYHVAIEQFDPQLAAPDNLGEANLDYERLVALRHEHFGYDTAEKLFGSEQAHARYTIESMRIQSTPGLSQADKDRMQAQLRQRLPEGRLPGEAPVSDAWRRRYAAFEQEKQLILSAGLAPADELRQIEQLMSAHFRPDELEAARNYVPVEQTP